MNHQESSRALQAVIFDCDGILVNTEPLHYRAFQEVLEPLGLGFDYEHYMRVYIGFDDRDAFAEAFREKGRDLGASRLAELMEAKNRILQSIVARGIESFPGVTALIKELLRREVPLAVASGALRDEVEAFTTALNIRHAFRVIVAADDVARSKPDPETYLAAMERMRTHGGVPDLEPAGCVAIEDTPAGIASARAAGMCVVAVTNSFGPEKLGEAHQVVESLDRVSVRDMAALVDRCQNQGRA